MHGDAWVVGVAFWIVVVLGAVLAAAIWGARKSREDRASGGAGPGETPLDVLRMRYARGDISREEFEHMRRELA